MQTCVFRFSVKICLFLRCNLIHLIYGCILFVFTYYSRILIYIPICFIRTYLINNFKNHLKICFKQKPAFNYQVFLNGLITLNPLLAYIIFFIYEYSILYMNMSTLTSYKNYYRVAQAFKSSF